LNKAAAATSGRGYAGLIVYSFILFVGALLFWCYPRFPDVTNAPPYLELARALFEKGSYSFNSHVETLLPPGYSFLLGLIGSLFGWSEPVIYRSAAVFTVLGLAACFEVLRRAENAWAAAITTMLLGAAPAVFTLATAGPFPDVPYLFTSMLCLLLAIRAERAQSMRARCCWIAGLGISVALTIMIRSVGVALLPALVAWIGFSSLRAARPRLLLFVIPLVMGIGVQLGWSHWASARQTTQWELPGYPESYLSQLRVKNGNEPELGYAGLGDILKRPASNIRTRTAEMAGVLTHHWFEANWASPVVCGTLLLILIGWLSSIRRGGQLYDWYFACYEGVYAFWPWEFELRFLVPSIPLACLYVWRGAKTVRALAARQPRLTGAALMLCGVALTASSLLWALRERSAQPFLALGFWALIILAGLRLAFRGKTPALRHPAQRDSTRFRLAWSGLLTPRHAVWVVSGLVIAAGCLAEARTARANLSLTDLEKSPVYPEIEASQWIRAHEDPTKIVMARRDDLVYHYSRHPVIWFPPIGSPETLLDGMDRHHVGVIVVIDRTSSYWRPAEQECFQELQKRYCERFTLVHRGPHNRVYELRTGTSHV